MSLLRNPLFWYGLSLIFTGMFLLGLVIVLKGRK